MNYTNHHSLPEPLFNAVARDSYIKEGHISVTGLIKPPQMVALEREHWDEITVDVADEIYSLLGSSVHAILDRAGADNALQEETLRVAVNGWILTGRPDLLDAEGVLSDFKVTSVFSFSLGEKSDWQAQLNLYAALYRVHGFEVKAAQIIGILRDWVKRRAETEEGYPQAPALVMPIELWPHERAVKYIKQRIELHQKALEGEYPPCTAEERWYRGEKWALKKNQNKRAVRLFDDEESAELTAEAMNRTKADTYTVEHRPGDSVRCQYYCKAARWCVQANGEAA